MLDLARVVAVNPARRTVDLVSLTNGARLAAVRVMSGLAGSDGLAWSVPPVPRPADELSAAAPAPEGRTLIAVVGMVQGRPLVLGFVPHATAMPGVDEQDRAIYRHPSGAYVTIGADGAIEARHPSGAKLRLGQGDGGDVPGLAAAPAGAAPAQATLVTGSVTLKVKPGGEVELTCTKLAVTGDIEATGDVKAGNISLRDHKHGQVQPGSGQSGVAVP